jgi:hypothetical protein
MAGFITTKVTAVQERHLIINLRETILDLAATLDVPLSVLLRHAIYLAHFLNV